MQTTQANIVTTLFVTTLVVLFVLGGFVLVVVHFRNRYNNFSQEKTDLHKQFQETLMRSQLEIQEHTLNHISQEIHDNIGQELSLVKMQLNIFEELQTFDPSLVHQTIINLNSAMANLRNIASGMNAGIIQNFSLAENLLSLCNRIAQTNVVQIIMAIDGKEKEISSATGLITYRIVQECIQNIIKHAKADTASVKLIYLPNHFLIEIKDDGIGFDLAAISISNRGMGLQNIRSRATVIGGQAQIDSGKNIGTFITMTIPYG